jgi:hypothetical protein
VHFCGPECSCTNSRIFNGLSRARSRSSAVKSSEIDWTNSCVNVIDKKIMGILREKSYELDRDGRRLAATSEALSKWH